MPKRSLPPEQYCVELFDEKSYTDAREALCENEIGYTEEDSFLPRLVLRVHSHDYLTMIHLMNDYGIRHYAF